MLRYVLTYVKEKKTKQNKKNKETKVECKRKENDNDEHIYSERRSEIGGFNIDNY